MKIMLVDDHDIVRQAVRSLLSDKPPIEIVGEAESGEEAIKKVADVQPELILMDLYMSGIGGVESTRVIHQRHPHIKILILTSCMQSVYFSWLLKISGASGYITKDADISEMLLAIKTVYAGNEYISPKLLTIMQESGDTTPPFEVLSARELQIVFMLVSKQSVKDIANKLHVATKTVNSHRYLIFEKLNISSDVELFHMAIKYGLVSKFNLLR